MAGPGHVAVDLNHLPGSPRSIQRVGIDHRVILIGSLLSDIIDKPLVFEFFPSW